MPLDSLPEPNVTPPDHVPDELVRMYGREAQQSVRYSRSRRYRMSNQVRTVTSGFHDTEVWSAAGLVFFWGVAIVALLGGLAYSVYLWPAAGLALIGIIGLLAAISVTVGLKQTRRQRKQPAEEYTSYSF